MSSSGSIARPLPLRYAQDGPALVNGIDYSRLAHLPELWTLAAEQFGSLTALHDPHGGPIDRLSFAQLDQHISQCAAGLQSLVLPPEELHLTEAGLKIPPRVALVADNSPRWLIADQGSLRAGFANAVRSSTAETEELLYILADSRSEILLIENQKTLQRLAEKLAGLPLAAIVLLSDEVAKPTAGLPESLRLLNWGELMDLGSQPPQAVQRDRTTLATLIYTSGTTGRPKGVMLSHGNLLHQVMAIRAVVAPQPGDRVLTLLPSWHSFGRMGDYFLLSQGCTTVYTNIRHVKADFKTYRPHYMTAVPRLWESIYEGVQKQLASQAPKQQKLVARLLGWSERYVLARRDWQGLNLAQMQAGQTGNKAIAGLKALAYWPLHRLADKLAYGKIRAATGGEFRYAFSGGGSLAAHLELFFEIVGINVLVGYGLTETSPVVSARRPWRNLRASSGLPIPGTELKAIDPETRRDLPPLHKGLILARGPQIMAGYFGQPAATAKVIDAQGWFDTGDLGWISPLGDITITGRAKDTIVLTNGENIEPQPIEDACLRSVYVQQIVLVGQDQKTLGALIAPNLEALATWAKAQGRTFAAPNEPAGADSLRLESAEVQSLYRSELAREIKNRPGYKAEERLSVFCFLPEPMSIENGLLTQTMKVRRNVVGDRYGAEIAAMFAD